MELTELCDEQTVEQAVISSSPLLGEEEAADYALQCL